MSLENKIHIFAPPCIIIHQTHYEKSDWSRAFNQFTIACDVKFNACLVTKPLGVFSSETEWLNASLLFLRMNYEDEL